MDNFGVYFMFCCCLEFVCNLIFWGFKILLFFFWGGINDSLEWVFCWDLGIKFKGSFYVLLGYCKDGREVGLLCLGLRWLLKWLVGIVLFWLCGNVIVVLLYNLLFKCLWVEVFLDLLLLGLLIGFLILVCGWWLSWLLVVE